MNMHLFSSLKKSLLKIRCRFVGTSAFNILLPSFAVVIQACSILHFQSTAWIQYLVVMVFQVLCMQILNSNYISGLLANLSLSLMLIFLYEYTLAKMVNLRMVELLSWTILKRIIKM